MVEAIDFRNARQNIIVKVIDLDAIGKELIGWV